MIAVSVRRNRGLREKSDKETEPIIIGNLFVKDGNARKKLCVLINKNN